MKGFTDIHAHFVYGVDDGAQTRQDMEAMLDAAHADKVASLFATPHVTPGIRPFDEALFAAHLDEARAYCRDRGYEMDLFPGAEILYTPALSSYIMERRLPTLGESNWVLLEFSPDIELQDMQNALKLMEHSGYTTLIAHAERYHCLFRGNNAARIREQYDVRFQINANTVLNPPGFFRARHLRKWFRVGWVEAVASDAHDTQRRPFRMKKAYRVLKESLGPREAARLTRLHER